MPTTKEMLTAAEEAGTPCTRHLLIDFVEGGLIDKPECKERGSRAVYPQSSLIRFLILLRCHADQPNGLGRKDKDKLRRFMKSDLGTVHSDFLPAIAYIMGIPGIAPEEARASARKFHGYAIQDIRNRLDDPNEVEAVENTLGPGAVGMVSMAAYPKEYSDPSIYARPEQDAVPGEFGDHVEVNSRTLRDQIAEYLGRVR